MLRVISHDAGGIDSTLIVLASQVATRGWHHSAVHLSSVAFLDPVPHRQTPL